MILVKNITNLIQYLVTVEEFKELIEEQKKDRGEQLTFPIEDEKDRVEFVKKVKSYKCSNLDEKLKILKSEGFDIDEKVEKK